MAEHVELKQLLVVLARSFLQYADTACLWATGASGMGSAQLAQLADAQRQDVGRIVGHLQRDDPGVEFGTFPTDYTDLHFLSLEFLANQLLDNQTSLVDQIDGLLTDQPDGSPECTLLSEVLTSEREILDGVKQLVAVDPQTTSNK